MGRKVKGLQEQVSILDDNLFKALAMIGKLSIVVDALIAKGVISLEEINDAAKKIKSKT